MDIGNIIGIIGLSAIGVVVSIGSYRGKKLDAERETKYQSYIADLDARLNALHSQLRILCLNPYSKEAEKIRKAYRKFEQPLRFDKEENENGV